MSKGERSAVELIFVPPEYWSFVQATVAAAVSVCNDMSSQVEAHQRLGQYNAEELLDQMNAQAREIRKLLEMIEAPF